MVRTCGIGVKKPSITGYTISSCACLSWVLACSCMMAFRVESWTSCSLKGEILPNQFRSRPLLRVSVCVTPVLPFPPVLLFTLKIQREPQGRLEYIRMLSRVTRARRCIFRDAKHASRGAGIVPPLSSSACMVAVLHRKDPCSRNTNEANSQAAHVSPSQNLSRMHLLTPHPA